MPNILIDTVTEYDAEKKKYLLDLWEKIVLSMANEFDHKKLLLFLGKVGVIDIDETKKEVVIGAANDFSLSNLKSKLSKALKEAVAQCYNPQYGVRFVVYTPFSEPTHELLSDLKKLLNIQDEPNKRKSNERLEEGIRNELTHYFGILFEPRYRFDTFIAGSNNQFAFSAAKAVSENPGKGNNPLFLYGNVGLGKTHLMQAVGNEIMEKFPDKVVIYLPTSKLIDEIVQAIRSNKMSELNRKFNQVDVLLVDDIQFLAGAERTQDVFHDLFNDFYSKNKQVIISGDRPPKELTRITPRLQSRFSYGTIVDIQAPDFETRVAILESKLQGKGISIDRECLSIIAEYVKSNVRELEGALNTLLTRSQIMGGVIDENLVYSCLRTLGYNAGPNADYKEPAIIGGSLTSTKNFDTLIEMVANYYEISIADIKGESRKRQISRPRQLLMYIARMHFKWGFVQIGDYFGKNHASVMHSVDVIEEDLKNDSELQHDYRVFSDWVQQ